MNETVNTVSDWSKWLPSLISVVVLIINILYYIFGQPKVSFRLKRKENLITIAEEMLNYLSLIVSMEDLSGVPTKVRNYSISIHLCFKKGIAPKEIAELLEIIFQSVKKRKGLTSSKDVEIWATEFRDYSRNLRVSIAKYIGVF